jgi:hypothetical protein
MLVSFDKLPASFSLQTRSIQGHGLDQSECIGLWAALNAHGEDLGSQLQFHLHWIDGFSFYLWFSVYNCNVVMYSPWRIDSYTCSITRWMREHKQIFAPIFDLFN